MEFDVYQNAAGANTQDNPLLVILGIPNYNGAALSILSATSYQPYAGTASGGTAVTFGSATTDLYGGTYGTSTASAAAIMTAAAGHNEAYTDLGLGAANNSNNFVNWAAFVDAHNGATGAPTSFGLYVYRINVALVANGLVDIKFNGANKLPAGTIAIAYDCQGTLAANGACSVNPNSYNTPFTEAGGVTNTPSTPEPGSVFLLGTTMIGLGAMWRKRKSNKTV